MVLLVEDDEATSAVIADALRDEGHEVVCASDGESGLDSLARLPVTLVLLDLRLPKMTGEEFLLHRRARGLEAKARVVVVSSAGTAARASEVRELGASLTITKPFDAAELLAVVSKFGAS